MGRHQAREIAFRMLFQMDVGKNNWDTARHTMVEAVDEGEVRKRDCEYIEEVVRGVMAKREEIDVFISRHAQSWSLERVNPVERNIIRLALYEIWYMADIPLEVALNEAVELSKTYGESDAYAFVNGVLDNVRGEEKEGKSPDVPCREALLPQNDGAKQ